MNVIDKILKAIDKLQKNCGIGPGGFQPGNTCARGGGGGGGSSSNSDSGMVLSASDKKILKKAGVPKKYHKNYQGVEYINDDDHLVFEFDSDDGLDSFLGEVGGMPHPLGGFRAILSQGD